MENLAVTAEWKGCLLDEYIVAHWPDISKGRLRDLIRGGAINIEGMSVQPSAKLKEGQLILIDHDMSTEKRMKSADIDLEILYQDEHLVAVNKPAGIPVEPSRWGEHPLHLSGALLSWAQKRELEGPLQQRPRALHRIDLGTTGVMLYALSLEAERYYRELFANRKIDKKYHALVLGEVHYPGVVDSPIAPDASAGGLMRVYKHGKESLTEYEALTIFHGYTLIEARPKTGRTHQIRVHMSSVGHPLVVDPRYGGAESFMLSEIKRDYRPKAGRPEKPLIDHLTLHAHSVSLPKFGSDEMLHIEAPYPKNLRVTLRNLAKWREARVGPWGN